MSFDGKTAPYLQYTHARCCSVIEKAGEVNAAPDYSVLTDDDSFALATRLAAFDQAVVTAGERRTQRYFGYLLDLAKLYNRFYLSSRILGEPAPVQSARLALTRLTRDVLKTGLGLLLISAPTAM
ncbi:MAG: DALR anticodon-binding domain-containing protein [Christensenellales bacterium]